MGSKTRPFMVSCDCVKMGQIDEHSIGASVGSAREKMTASVTASASASTAAAQESEREPEPEPVPETKPEPELQPSIQECRSVRLMVKQVRLAGYADAKCSLVHHINHRGAVFPGPQNDDLRKDQIVLDSIELMCTILKAEMPGLNLPLVRPCARAVGSYHA